MPSYGFSLCSDAVFAEQVYVKVSYVTLLQISLIKIQNLLFHEAVESNTCWWLSLPVLDLVLPRN